MRFVDSGGWRGPTRLTRRGKVSGSGSARLGLSQKGDLPSSGGWIVFIWSKAANARKFLRERPRHRPKPGPPASLWAKKVLLSGTHPNKSHECTAFL